MSFTCSGQTNNILPSGNYEGLEYKVNGQFIQIEDADPERG